MQPPSASISLWRTALRSGLLIAGLGGLAWATGQPLLFPSLGPTAFVLSMRPDPERHSAWTVIGGHACGTVAGLLSYHLLAPGTSIVALEAALTPMGLQLAASGACATALTAALMIGTRTVHPPACATTLIVSLGLLPTFVEGGLIVGAVAVLYGLSWAGARYGPTTSWGERSERPPS